MECCAPETDNNDNTFLIHSATGWANPRIRKLYISQETNSMSESRI